MFSSDGILLRIADVIFYILHIAIISFNLFGWIRKKTLRAHLVVAGLTLFSWIVLGIWYGFGYCFLTDWHWQIKRQLGQTNLPSSFVTYFFHSLGWPLSASVADMLTIITFGLAISISVYKNIRLRRAQK